MAVNGHPCTVRTRMRQRAVQASRDPGHETTPALPPADGARCRSVPRFPGLKVSGSLTNGPRPWSSPPTTPDHPSISSRPWTTTATAIPATRIPPTTVPRLRPPIPRSVTEPVPGRHPVRRLPVGPVTFRPGPRYPATRFPTTAIPPVPGTQGRDTQPPDPQPPDPRAPDTQGRGTRVLARSRRTSRPRQPGSLTSTRG